MRRRPRQLVGGQLHPARAVDPKPIDAFVEIDFGAIHFHSPRGGLRWLPANRNLCIRVAGPRDQQRTSFQVQRFVARLRCLNFIDLHIVLDVEIINNGRVASIQKLHADQLAIHLVAGRGAVRFACARPKRGTNNSELPAAFSAFDEEGGAAGPSATRCG